MSPDSPRPPISLWLQSKSLGEPFILSCTEDVPKYHSYYCPTCISNHNCLPTKCKYRFWVRIFFWWWSLGVVTFFWQRSSTQPWISIKWTLCRTVSLVVLALWAGYPTHQRIQVTSALRVVEEYFLRACYWRGPLTLSQLGYSKMMECALGDCCWKGRDFEGPLN